MAGKVVYKNLNSYVEKLNPAQSWIQADSGTVIDSVPTTPFSYYERLGVVQRGVNMIVDAASQIDVILPKSIIRQDSPPIKNVRASRVEAILNSEPNPFMDISTFRRLIFTDLIVEGNAFIYFDGSHLYHCPAHLMSIETDSSTYVAGYKLQTIKYTPEEIIHIKDNSLRNIYRGSSRLTSALNNMILLYRMTAYQDKFFQNGAVPGLVLKSENSLSDKLKQKMIDSWLRSYAPENGGKRPLILDGGLELDRLSNTTFQELDFEKSIKVQETAILKALGVPTILLDGGNNANIRPNQRLFYIETVIPLVDKFMKAFERYFGYKLIPDNDIPGMQPELQEQASYAVNLVNAGILTPNEARDALAFEKLNDPEMDKIRIPQNIAGSAVNPSIGGRPPETKE